MATALTSGQESLISAVMLTNNRVERCMESVRKTAAAMNDVSAGILVINNGQDPIPLPSVVDGIPCRIVNLGRNIGAAARNISLEETRSEFLLMLDDDAYVDQDTIRAAIHAFQSDPGIGAVAFSVRNDTEEEACLLPTVFHGCACCFRSEALREVGGYPDRFLYYGEEYHVAFRLFQAGYRIVRLSKQNMVRHARDAGGRNLNRIIRLLVRNNARLWSSFLPWRYLGGAICDSLRRYSLVARKERAWPGFVLGCLCLPFAAASGLLRRKALDIELFRRVGLIDQLDKTAADVAAMGAKDIVVCGVGKFPSIWRRVLALRGIRIRAYLDTNTCWRGSSIGGVPVLVPRSTALGDVKRIVSQLSGGGYITGLSSSVDTAYWEHALDECGLRRLGKDGAEQSSDSGTIDLLDSPKLAVFAYSFFRPSSSEVPRLTWFSMAMAGVALSY